jgi:hypothetical protein
MFASSDSDPLLAQAGLLSPRRIVLAFFYLGFPLLLVLVLSITEAGTGRFPNKGLYLVKYTLSTVPIWWSYDLLARAFSHLLRPWRPQLWVVLICAVVMAHVVLVGPWSLVWQQLMTPYLTPGSSFFAGWPLQPGDPKFLTESLLATFSGFLFFGGLNLLLFFGLGMERYGYSPSRARPPPVAPPPQAGVSLLARLPEDIGGDVIALEAKEHYTQVVTTRGKALVLYRFSDAVRELAYLPGVQVHRSHWVNTNAIRSIEPASRGYTITLKNGLRVPVSRSYKVKLQELGLAP